MSAHTKEPLRIRKTIDPVTRGPEFALLDATGTCVATCQDPKDALRMAATWDACAGIPTEALEEGALKELIEALADSIAALESITGEAWEMATTQAREARAALAKVRP